MPSGEFIVSSAMDLHEARDLPGPSAFDVMLYVAGGSNVQCLVAVYSIDGIHLRLYSASSRFRAEPAMTSQPHSSIPGTGAGAKQKFIEVKGHA